MKYLGLVDVPFTLADNCGVAIHYDESTEQQFFEFKLSLHVSVPQLLQQLVAFQKQQMHGQDTTTSCAGNLSGAQKGCFSQTECDIPAASYQRNPETMPPLTTLDGSILAHGTAEQLLQTDEQQRWQESWVYPEEPILPPVTQSMPDRPTLPSETTGAAKSGHFAGSRALVAASAMKELSPCAPAPGAGACFQLYDAIRQNHVSRVTSLLREGHVDVNADFTNSLRKTPLIFALEQGTSLKIICDLIQAQADVNKPGILGRTPIMTAIQMRNSLPVIAIRTLMYYKARLDMQDAHGTTAIDALRLVAEQLTNGSAEEQAAQTVQILDETVNPTVCMHVTDGSIRGIQFADMDGDKIMFYTESAVSVYSMQKNKVVVFKKLKQEQRQFSLLHASVNAATGTLAVLIEIPDQQNSRQNVCIVWPTGHMQSEEPLKLSIKVGPDRLRSQQLAACVILCRSKPSEPQTLLVRLQDSQIWCYCLNHARAQVTSDPVMLCQCGGIMAADHDCTWIAMMNFETDAIDIWFKEGQRLAQVVNLPRRPAQMDILASKSAPDTCLLALYEPHNYDQFSPLAPIEVLQIQGSSISTAYRVALSAPCRSLSFCHKDPDYLVAASIDGLIVTVWLPTGQQWKFNDSPGLSCVASSPDRKLCAAAEDNHFRVFRIRQDGTS